MKILRKGILVIVVFNLLTQYGLAGLITKENSSIGEWWLLSKSLYIGI